MNRLKSLSRLAALLLVAATVLTACAQDVPDINRTQPNAIRKSDLDGEWYYQRTVVDMPAADGFTFVGNTDQKGLTKIKWDIQENFLYARRQTELIEGADLKAQQGDNYRGEVVAAYRILSHFDIQRQYNPQTGEQTNVIVENMSDRPWYERKYMRVDWSTNLVTNYDLDFERQSVEPVPYYVQQQTDPKTGKVIPNPDAPVFDYKTDDQTKDKQLSYFDITNRLYARAGTVNIPGYGEVPMCWLMGHEFSECGAGEYTIRNSFKRIDPNHQYVPRPYKGKATDMFGFFTTDRLVYDSKNGIREQEKKRYLNRHNMWKKWYDADGHLIPASQRELRPIVYYVNREMPEDLKPMAQAVADKWNKVFDDVVTAQGYNLKDGERTFILCPNNPVKEGDPAACGDPGTAPRLGDIRYSFIAYVPKFMQFGLLGYGPSNTDPETGEIVSGMAYVYHWNNVATYQTQEMVELLNGTKDPKKFIDGVDLTQWVHQVNDPDVAPAHTYPLNADEKFVDNIANRYKGQRMPITAADVAMQKKEGFDKFIKGRFDQMYHMGILNGEGHSPEGKLASLKNTYIEDMMVNDEVLMGTGHEPGTAVTDADMNAASVLRGGMGEQTLIKEKLRNKLAAQRNMYLAGMNDDALMGLARELKGKDPDTIYKTIRKTIYTAVWAHEVGHTLGLMHNFGGSEDAVNYWDKYWQIRDDGNVGPRMTDPITQDEINKHLYDYGYASIMDYAGRYTIDGKGPGKYDRAAMLYGYAGKVEVFKDASGVSPTVLRDWADRQGQVLQFTQLGPRAFHYTSWYNQMGDKLYKASNRMLVDVSDLEVVDGKRDWSKAKVNGKEYYRVPYIYCSHANANLSDTCLTRDAGADSYERMKNMIDGLNTWYITRAFPRGKVGRSSWGYVNAYYPSIYHRLKYWNDLYGLYTALLPTVYPPSTVKSFLTDPVNGWGEKSWAVKNAFNYLMQTLLMPNVGQYQKRTMVDGTTMLTSPQTSVDANLDITQGRYYSTSWGDGNRECGYFWWECLHHIGYYLDKIMAIEALTDTRTNFVARSTPEDIRQWEVGYFNTFPDQMLELNDAIMSQKWDKYAPYMTSNGGVQFPDYSGDMNDTHAEPVDPYATFTIQLYWTVLGQARFPDGFSRNFLDESRIFVEGTGNAPDVAQADKVDFTDPWTGFTYGAAKMQDTSGHQGAGQGMLERANLLLRRSTMCDDSASTMDTADDCEQGVSAQEQAQATQKLKSYIDLIKVVADLAPRMGYGNAYSP